MTPGAMPRFNAKKLYKDFKNDTSAIYGYQMLLVIALCCKCKAFKVNFRNYFNCLKATNKTMSKEFTFLFFFLENEL